MIGQQVLLRNTDPVFLFEVSDQDGNTERIDQSAFEQGLVRIQLLVVVDNIDINETAANIVAINAHVVSSLVIRFGVTELM